MRRRQGTNDVMTSPLSLQASLWAGQVSDARVYVAYHDARPVLEGRHLVPIQVGRALSGMVLPGVQGDDTGDNISGWNGGYCELTAHYWAWRNDPSDGAIGLMHYRRLFDLGGRLPARSHPERHVAGFDTRTYAGDAARHFARATSRDLVVPRPVRLRRTLARQYARCHRPEELRAMQDVVAERHPDFLPALDRALRGNRLLPGNMFIMPRPVLDHYSPLLFDILHAACDRLAARDAQPGYQARYPGFLAERILTAYVLGGHVQAAFPDLRVHHMGIMNIDPAVPAGATWLRLARLCVEGRIGLRDALRLKAGRNRP